MQDRAKQTRSEYEANGREEEKRKRIYNSAKEFLFFVKTIEEEET
jgi:hypothetical protein